MGKVKQLKPEVYNKIAAGEVVERPLSVVKELVENAIDAGADEITIELIEAGRRSIRIRDNGEGFHEDDVEQAFQRHSTSKFTELRDFDKLATLGFRGEALPSVLEVSRIELRSSDNDSGSGIRVLFEDNQVVEKEAIAFNKGTSIEVRDLFYNFPVRRKFLKSDRTEQNQIVTYLEQAALVNSTIAFTLRNNGREIFSYRKSSDLKDRIFQVLGKELLEGMQEVDYEDGGYRLKGYVSKLNTGISTKKKQFFFVNSRPVREKTLYAALNNTFTRFLEKHRYPAAVILMDVPPVDIDVNIHPMKLEVKFRDTSLIFGVVKEAVKSSFYKLPATDEEYEAELAEDMENRKVETAINSEKTHETSRTPVTKEQLYNIPTPAMDFVKDSGYKEPSQVTLFDVEEVDTREDEIEFNILGQYNDSYIIIEKDGELMVVDQHNAHERANYDNYVKAFRNGVVDTVAPLFPRIIELTASEIDGLDEAKLELLNRLGFELRDMGGRSYDIKRYPAILKEKEIVDTVRELLSIEGSDEKLEEKLFATVSCKSAIKINHKLHQSEMHKIVENLFKTENPWFCPHRRPIIIRMSLEDIEKKMKRR